MQHKNQSGALTVEAALGTIIFLTFIGFIIDFGMTVHRHALLVDLTLKTIQQVTRDPSAAESGELLALRSEDLFSQMAARVSTTRNADIQVEVHYSCEDQAILLSSKWEAPCAFCLFGRFKATLTAQGYGAIESPRIAADCAQSA